MEMIYVQPSFSIPEKFEGPLSGVWQKIKENIQQLKALQGRCTTLAIVLQAAEHEVDVKVQSNGKSASPEDPVDKQQAAESIEDVKVQSNGKSASPQDPENKEQATESKEDVNVRSNGKSASPEDPVDKQQAAESIEDAKLQSNGRCQDKSASPEDPVDKQLQASERKENVNEVQSNEKSASTEDPGGKQQAAESKENVNGQSNEKSASPEDPGGKQLQATESKENVNGQSNVSIGCGSINYSENKQQTAESKEDVNVQSHEKSASPEDPGGEQQAAERKENVNGQSNDTAKRNISDKANTNGYRYLLIALGIFTLLSGAYGDVDPVRFCIRVNQSVNLPAGAKLEDVVEWFLSPAQNSAEYISLYASYDNGKISRKDGCEGFDFGRNHSMFIASAQLCHAGTYTVDIRGGDLRTIVLIVDDVAENSTETTCESDVAENSTETTYESVTLPLSAVTPASTTVPKDDNSWMVVLVAVCCVFTVLVVVAIAIILIWKRKSIWKKASADGNNVHMTCAQANREENANLLPQISIVLPQS